MQKYATNPLHVWRKLKKEIKKKWNVYKQHECKRKIQVMQAMKLPFFLKSLKETFCTEKNGHSLFIIAGYIPSKCINNHSYWNR